MTDSERAKPDLTDKDLARSWLYHQLFLICNQIEELEFTGDSPEKLPGLEEQKRNISRNIGRVRSNHLELTAKYAAQEEGRRKQILTQD